MARFPDSDPVSQETIDIIKHTAHRVQQIICDGVELMPSGDDSIRLLYYVLDDLAIVTMVSMIAKLPQEKRTHDYALKLALSTINHTASSPKAKKFFNDAVAQYGAQELLARILDAQPGRKPPT